MEFNRKTMSDEMRPRIPFNKPAFVGTELQYIKDAVDRGMLCGDG